MEIINFLKAFVNENGAASLVVLVLTVIITNIVKKPMKAKAAKIVALAESAGFKITESVITGNISYLPYAVAFVLFVIAEGIKTGFGSAFDFVAVLAETTVVATMSVGLYSVVANTLERLCQAAAYKDYQKDKIKKETEEKEANKAEANKAEANKEA